MKILYDITDNVKMSGAKIPFPQHHVIKKEEER